MNNVVRKALREEVERLGKLSKACSSDFERTLIDDARISLVKADYHDFHINPSKRYNVPKTNFKFD